ncbi:patatin-like phospholipase family protein [Actinomycetospora sp. TBRC 11914]|uniref:patatin-like phospholipase family protein n=1 Tax=Actinomycetospora sp. TBRC 11914 TaxID=2729387 RepID=UPI00145ED000|nr:patatin-like phospholipase family protein [Actinomycetospora sp. TBRC 11914]NMO90329.1 patatin [Actinomycetospora sp. TBRC 11914]
MGLAVEGGGLRGVVSAAMLCALEDLGFADSFDDVYACSSGAVNAAYFLNGATWFPLNIYFDDLTTKNFLDYRRLYRGKPVMDLDYVYDEVLARRKPLDYGQIRSSVRPLHILVTNVSKMRREDAYPYKDDNDVRDALRASTWLPLATYGAANFRGQPFIDGGVVQFHPYTAAVADKCTHILSLSTKPMSHQPAVSRTNRYLVRPWLNRMRDELGDAFINSLEKDASIDKPLLRNGRMKAASNPSILDLAPLPDDPEIRRNEAERGALIRGAGKAYRVPYAVLENEEIEPVIRFIGMAGASTFSSNFRHGGTGDDRGSA